MTVESFSSQELAMATAALRQLDKYRNAVVIGQGFWNILQLTGLFDLQAYEQIYRKIGSDTFLLALPVRLLDGDELTSISPVDESEQPYWLKICVEGKAEADETLAEAGTSYEENFANLANVGYPTLRPNSVSVRRLKAPNN